MSIRYINPAAVARLLIVAVTLAGQQAEVGECRAERAGERGVQLGDRGWVIAVAREAGGGERRPGPATGYEQRLRLVITKSVFAVLGKDGRSWLSWTAVAKKTNPAAACISGWPAGQNGTGQQQGHGRAGSAPVARRGARV